MKKIIVISIGKITGLVIADQLKNLLRTKAHVDCEMIQNINEDIIDHDLILFTSDLTCKLCLKKLKEIDVPFIIADRVINHKNIKELISLPNRTKVLLVNDHIITTKEAKDQLLDIGLDHITYVPYSPGEDTYLDLTIAVTPGEPQLVPSHITKIIDIGTRILDVRTVYEIQRLLGHCQPINQSLVVEYLRDIIEISKSIDRSRESEKQSNLVLETIFDTVEYGLAYLDKDCRIIKTNSKFLYIIGKKKKDVLYKRIQRIIENFDFIDLNTSHFNVDIGNEHFLIDVQNIDIDNRSGYLLIFNPLKSPTQLEKDNSSTILANLHTFKDYISIDARVLDSLEMAKRFSKTDATISIQGENGTGKEIIAQGIHMHSYRRKKPFVPVNIAAISPNLLESELFGYERGSFTGANKDGKPGLFEVSNGGTIFIDEIGDAPIDIQVKLLRVLQEKKIRRIGGTDEIPIDVRVITATNKDLLKLVDDGSFREDLFFRLNTLPLRTLPLRMRKADINHLLFYFIEIYFTKHNFNDIYELLDADTIKYLNEYRWRGNVRELINLVEYLSYVYIGNKITMNYLPQYLFDQNKNISNLTNNEIWVLQSIYDNPGIGRKAIHNQSINSDINISEGQIRGILARLTKDNLITSQGKKRGSIVTNKGITQLANSI